MPAWALTVVLAACPGQADAVDPADLARVRAYEHARVQLVERLAPTVVCMFGRGERIGGGSGVVIDAEGYGLTNFHVVAGMMKDRLGDGGMSDHQLYPLDVLGIDPTGDVAMFKLHRPEPFAFAPLGDSGALRIGDYAMAMGNPFLLAEDYTPTVTLGIISGIHRYQWGVGRALRYTDCIQVDTSINPGNSGGPLFDMAGNLIGINGRVSIEERGRVNVGVGYAISINQIKRFIPALRAGLPTKHATAGFTVFDRDGRVIVDQILDDSPAYMAGLRLGDEILRFGGAAIRTQNHFASLLGVYPGGWPVQVSFRRDQEVRSIRIRLENLPFPKQARQSPAGGGATNPYAPHAVTKTANRRAVARAFKKFLESTGGPGAFRSVRSIHVRGERLPASRGPDAWQPFEDSNVRPTRPDAVPAENADAFEAEILWMLLDAANDPTDGGYSVIGGDEVLGDIAVVIERDAVEKTDFRVAFDDRTGALLRLEFRDPRSRKEVRYEYGDHRRVGHVKLPHKRWIYFDDALYAEDRFDEVEISSSAS